MAHALTVRETGGVLERPETRYAKSGDVYLAYQVIGDEPLDLVYVPGLLSHVEWMWEWAPLAGFLRRLASFRRLIVFDKRGMGLSDRSRSLATVEQQMDDIGAVMDAAGSERVDLLGGEDGATMALVFAATYPDRVRSVITYSTRARFLPDVDYPWGTPREVVDSLVQVVVDTWGGDGLQWILAPSAASDEQHNNWFRQAQRLSASPGAVLEVFDLWTRIDSRAVLPAVRVPVLVLHRKDNPVTEIGHARYLADVLPDARLVELEGADEFFWVGDVHAVADEIQDFLTGVRSHAPSDRTFATVLFTDIVASTEQLVRLGDTGWRTLLDDHDRLAARVLRDFRGRLVKSTGDGLLAVFDGPGRAVRCAVRLRDTIGGLGIDLRAGLHSGEIELRGQDVGGLTVHIASRIETVAEPAEVLISRPTADLLAGEELTLSDRGEHHLKGVPGRWPLLSVNSPGATGHVATAQPIS
jgi:class 3 adenylate cyclase